MGIFYNKDPDFCLKNWFSMEKYPPKKAVCRIEFFGQIPLFQRLTLRGLTKSSSFTGHVSLPYSSTGHTHAW